MERRSKAEQKPRGADELFAKLRKVQNEIEAVRKDFVENPYDSGRRDDYLLILGSGVRLSLSLCRLLQSEVELLRRAVVAAAPYRNRKRRTGRRRTRKRVATNPRA